MDKRLTYHTNDLDRLQYYHKDETGTLYILELESGSQNCFENLNLPSEFTAYLIPPGEGHFVINKFIIKSYCKEFDYYLANVESSQDYYPFGSIMPGRNYQGSDGYGYGFQGQEQDDEIKGDRNSISYKYRIYDPRVGRFLSIDPLTKDYPHNSPYAFSENRVVDAVELEGLEKIEAYVKMRISWTGTQLKTVDGVEVEEKVKMSINLNLFIKHDLNDGTNNANFVATNPQTGTSATGAFNLEEGGVKDFYMAPTDLLGGSFEKKFDEGSIGIPGWAASFALDKIAADEFTPGSVDEATGMSQEEAQTQAAVRFTLKSISGLVKNKQVDVGYKGYDGSLATGVDGEGNTYEREFTHTFRLSGEGSTGSSDGLNVDFKAKVDYTNEKCTNCD